MSPFVRRLTTLAAMSAPVAAGLFRVWVHQDAVRVGYELAKEAKRRTELREAAKELEVELATERSPARLEALAARLGLERPTPAQMLGVTAAPRRAP